MTATLSDLVIQLAQARADRLASEKDRREMMEVAIARLKGSPSFVAADQRATAFAEKAAALENEIHELGADIFKGTDNKHPHPAVNIKEISVYKYDPYRAVNWCLIGLPGALKLNDTALKAAAKIGLVPADIVAVKKVPQVQIDTDLSAYLDPGKE